MTSYEYDSAGDVAQVTNPLRLVTAYTHDNLGRQLAQTQTSDTYPAGLTTSYTYDDQDQVITETDPPVTDRVTGAVHTEVTSHTYDPDGDTLTTTVSDSTGGTRPALPPTPTTLTATWRPSPTPWAIRRPTPMTPSAAGSARSARRESPTTTTTTRPATC